MASSQVTGQTVVPTYGLRCKLYFGAASFLLSLNQTFWMVVLNFDERFWEMPKLAWVVLEKFQYDLHNDEPLRMNAELFWRCAIPSAQCWRYAQWRTETKRRRKVTHVGQSICTNCGVGAEFCSYVQTVLTIGHLQLQKGVVCRPSTPFLVCVWPMFHNYSAAHSAVRHWAKQFDKLHQRLAIAKTDWTPVRQWS